MARPFNFVISFREINWKFSRHRHDWDHDWTTLGNQQGTISSILRFFLEVRNGRPIGIELTIGVTIKPDPRKCPRAYVSFRQLQRQLPDYIQQHFERRGINMKANRGEIPFARLKQALCSGRVTSQIDVHHDNMTTLDDRGVNLVSLHKADHALLHIYDGDVAGNQYHPLMLKSGFFDYREFQRQKAHRISQFIQNRKARKDAGLHNDNPADRPPPPLFFILAQLQKLHRKLIDMLISDEDS